MNHLQFESSPYLRQHAGNPVDWYPWSEAAFERARQDNKPVFLSIGYATCHWCHVMERESFENTEIADLLNANFIAIKVDREERPDIDAVYMSAVTAITGQGGWPLSVFLTPKKEPFFGGTYFPPEPRWGSPGFAEILRAIDHKWRSHPDQIITSGQQLTAQIRQTRESGDSSDELNVGVLDAAFASYSFHFDRTCAGMGQAPKFPTVHNLCFLLRYFRRTAQAPALEMAEQTLAAMSRGGICDQLGGGFHRYSTDRQWRVPHFEKMLYDQAMALRGYVEVFQVTRKPEYVQVIENLVGYVLRDLRHPRGAFFSAEDADSLVFDARGCPGHEKTEGAFYLWRVDEVAAIVGSEIYPVVEYVYGLTADGNTLNDPHQQFDSRNVFYQAHSVDETAARFQRSSLDIRTMLDSAKKKLLDARAHRPRPFLDDKILTDWNALMISSLAVAGAVLDRPDWIMAAETAMRFLLEKMFRADGRLWHRYRDDQAGIEGMLDDYAFLSVALLDLFEVTGTLDYLLTARQLIHIMNDQFWDVSEGGYFLTARDSEALINRPKIVYDGAIPSGNSLAALALVRLYHLTLDPEDHAQLRKLFQCFAAEVRQHPTAYSQLLSALDFTLGSVCEILLAPAKSVRDVVPFQREIWRHFLPNKVVRVRPVDSCALEKFLKVMPDARASGPVGERATVYVCENQRCHQPLYSVAEMINLLESDHG